MVAPNGARLTKTDHPALPLSVNEVVATARACRAAGADGLHAHVRDERGAHVLDAGLYRELLVECEQALPGFFVQITTEAAGRYVPEEQRRLVREVRPRAVSIALRETWPNGAPEREAVAARSFYAEMAEAGIVVQHILYAPEDILRLHERLVAPGTIRAAGVQLLYVLGRYAEGQRASPEDLDPFLSMADDVDLKAADWAVCAFGVRETDCLAYAASRGGKVRVGFENNRTMADGALAPDNAARVREVCTRLRRAPS